MALTFEIAGGQIDGARDYQEDAFLITHLTDTSGKPSTLVVVADGMGGHAAGNVASNMAVQAFNKYVSSNYPTEYVNEVLNGAVQKANHSIAETIKETPALDGMGCTMIAAIVEERGIWWASVGDSHLYLVRNRELTKINADHSYGGFLDAMAKAGTPVEPEPGLSRNMLMSAITGAEIAEIDCPDSAMVLQHGDKILICSDGMDTLSEGKIIQYIDWSDTPKECSEALLNAVEEAGMPKQDNTTAVVVKVTDKAMAASASAETAEDEDDDDEDITDTSGMKKPDLDKTADVPASAEPDFDVSPEPAPPPAPAASNEDARLSATVADEESVPAKEEKGGKGIIFGIAAAVIIAICVGGYFMFAGKKSGTSPEPVMSESPEISGEEPTTIQEEEAASEPESVTTTEPVSAGEEATVTETPVKEPEVAAEPEAKEIKEEPVVKTKAEETNVPKEFSDTLKDGSKGPVMVQIPGGSFSMGSPSSVPNADERPQHTVKVKKFAISKYEITFTEYDKFANATGKKLPDNLYMDREVTPVIFVSWDDAYNYTKWLSEQTGHKYRLPSEAEWEYAASAGQQTPFWWGFNEEPGKAHCFTCDSQFDPRKPTKIGSFKPNQFGVYDTAGNVSEWVYDCWHDNYKGAPEDGSVWEGGDCTQRITRGGSFISPQQSIRSAKRDKFKSDSGYDHVGIRLVREVD